MKESEPSGKVTVTSMDTMALDIYHSPVYHAFTGSNLVISATVTNNVGIKEAKVYYRVKGQTEWNSKKMTNVNDKYSVAIDAKYITVEGLEYYIEATDGNKFTYKGTAEEPYEVTIQEAVSGSDMGDVDGNGAIEIKDAMMVLMAINDRLNLTEIQFARADLDGSSAEYGCSFYSHTGQLCIWRGSCSTGDHCGPRRSLSGGFRYSLGQSHGFQRHRMADRRGSQGDDGFCMY